MQEAFQLGAEVAFGVATGPVLPEFLIAVSLVASGLRAWKAMAD